MTKPRFVLSLSCFRAVTEWLPTIATEDSKKVVLLHATGFHSRCWDEVVRRLDPTVHCIGIDLRGHGYFIVCHFFPFVQISPTFVEMTMKQTHLFSWVLGVVTGRLQRTACIHGCFLAKTLYAVLTPSKLLAQSVLGIRGKLPPPPPPSSSFHYFSLQYSFSCNAPLIFSQRRLGAFACSAITSTRFF